MSDIVERLRAAARHPYMDNTCKVRTYDALEAADEIEKLRAALKDCASDLEAEIRGRYTGGGGWDIHPALVTKFERDMSTVRAAAAALKETGDE